MTNITPMEIAIKQAQKGYTNDEVPIGAVVVGSDGKVISKAYNKREKSQNALLHAEIIAIDKACKKLNSWRLDNCSIYVTLMPCPMCAGAILNARIKTLYVGALATNDCQNLCEKILSDGVRLNHTTNIVFMLDDRCKNLIQNYFKDKRKEK